jgi:cation-transporting P-type ATPase 13A2
LVPGDIVKLSQAEFTLFPADMLLLSGDAIINDSMLTGESVPVSKIPATDSDLLKWKDGMDAITGEAARSFLHSGTRVVRIRDSLAADGSPGQPSIALVLRTGKLVSYLLIRRR